MKNDMSQNLLYEKIAELLVNVWTRVRSAVNQTMVLTYWQMGQFIVEDEQAGQVQAEYGSELIKDLSERLTTSFGKGFDITNLRHIRRFYRLFPNCDAVRRDLSWTHYWLSLKVENETARNTQSFT